MGSPVRGDAGFMIKQVFLHIGARKTGSSAIQVALVRNREALAANGLIYPECENDAAALAHKPTSGNGVLLAGILGPDKTLRSRRESVAQLRRDLSGTGRAVLYSSELFEASAGEDVSAFVDIVRSRGADVTVVYYLRNLLSYAVANYSQALKRGGYVNDFTRYIKSYRTTFAQTIETYSKLVPRERFLIRHYDRVRPNLIQDFFTIVLDGQNKDVAWDIQPQREINRSLTAEEMQIILLMNRLLRPHGRTFARAMSTAMSDYMIEHADCAKTDFVVTEDELRRFTRHNAEALEFVNEFAAGAVKLEMVGDRISIGAREEPSVTQRDRIFLALIEPLIAECAKLWAQHRMHSGTAIQRLLGSLRGAISVR